jgi:hypothetical protein
MIIYAHVYCVWGMKWRMKRCEDRTEAAANRERMRRSSICDEKHATIHDMRHPWQTHGWICWHAPFISCMGISGIDTCEKYARAWGSVREFDWGCVVKKQCAHIAKEWWIPRCTTRFRKQRPQCGTIYALNVLPMTFGKTPAYFTQLAIVIWAPGIPWKHSISEKLSIRSRRNHLSHRLAHGTSADTSNFKSSYKKIVQ